MKISIGSDHAGFEYKSKIRKLRKIRPDISISSDFIVGFPGETESDFEKTMELIHEVGFERASVSYTAKGQELLLQI